MPWVGLPSVIVAFPVHTHLLFVGLLNGTANVNSYRQTPKVLVLHMPTRHWHQWQLHFHCWLEAESIVVLSCQIFVIYQVLSRFENLKVC